MRRALFLGIVLLLAGCKGAASPISEHAPQVQSPRFASLEAVVSQLKAEKSPSPLARRLGITSCGIRPPYDGRPDSRPGQACADVKITVLHPKLDEGADTGMLQIEGLQEGDLVVFAREKDGSWSSLDAVRLDHPYAPLEIELRSLVKPPVQEILVHNISLARGNGVYFGDFLVLRLMTGRLQSVFAATEVGRLTGELVPPNLRYEMSSVFSFELGGIAETATYRVGNQRYEIVRHYQWSEEFHSFLPNYDDKIRVLGIQTPRKK